MKLKFISLFTLIGLFCVTGSTANSQTINITSAPYNASTGNADNAAAIQAAINAVGTNGTVLVPAGTFYSGPMTLKSNMIFQISAGATLMMLPMTATGSHPAYPVSADFLYGSKLTNTTINGSGVMDGQGQEWWTYFNGGGTDNRPPAMIELTGCTSVTVSGITVQNSPKFHIQFLGNGTNILASALSITAPWPSPNTDGIDLRGVNVNIQNCYISDGDDVVQIGGSNACNGVTVSGCTFGTGHGLSIGSITSGGVSNVLVDNCVFNGTQYGLRLKSNNTEGGITSNITYSNVTMSNIMVNPILMYSYYPTVPSNPATDTGSAANSTTPFWENIKFQNVTASQASTGTANVGIMWGLPQAPVSNILFDACTLTGSKIFDVFNTQGVTFDCNCLINGKAPSNTAAVTTYNAAMAGTDDVAFPACGPTATFTRTNTPSAATATFTSTPTRTNTAVPPTATTTGTSTATRTNTPMNTATATATPTRTSTAISTATSTSTHTSTPVPPTPTSTATGTSTATRTNTALPPTFTLTPTSTRTNTVVPPTFTNTATAIETSTLTAIPTWTATSSVSAPFARGADVGWLSQMESQGRTFQDNSGVTMGCLSVLQEKCINAIRLRVWVNPAAPGWSGKADVVAMAIRANAMGYRIMIDFHYSDSWADPGQQNKPAAWASYTMAQLVQGVHDHTVDVLSALSAAGVHPEWVQVGNETNDGMLWPVNTGDPGGRVSVNGFPAFAQLINSGYAAVKSVEPAAKVVIHISNGYDNTLFRWMFDGLKAAGANWDAIGMSLYPSTTNWATLDSQCLTNMNDMITRYGKPVVISEVGMDVTDPTNSFAFLSDIIAKNSGLPGGNGLGVFYWEPEAYNWMGYGLVAFDNTGKPTHAMDAFGNGCNLPTPTKTNTPVPPTATSTVTSTPTATGTNTLVPPTNTSTTTVTLTLTATRTHTPVPPTSTNTPVPPTVTSTSTGTVTATKTNTVVPPTATLTVTATATSTRTNTQVPPTATNTNSPVPPTLTPTATPVPPTLTPTQTLAPPSSTPTQTLVPPTLTATNSPVPPTLTSTAVLPTATNTPVPPTFTSTATPLPPTATRTSTLVPQTSTNTPVPPTATNTSIPPTSTNTPQPTSTFTSVPPTLTSTHTPVVPTATVTSTASFSATPSPSPTSTTILQGTVTQTYTPTAELLGVYPNPATGPTVNVLPPSYSGTSNVRVEIYSLAFRKVQDVTFTSVPSGTAVILNLTGRSGHPLSNGLYYLVVTTGGGRSTAKLLILR